VSTDRTPDAAIPEVSMAEASGVAAEGLSPPVEGPPPADTATPPVAPPVEPAPESAVATAATAVADAPAAPAAVTADAAASSGAGASADAGVATDVPAEAKPRRRLAMPLAVAWALRAIIGTALFVGGIAIGYAWYQSDQVETPAVIADPATAGVATPAVVREFVAALASNDSDALRSAVTGDPYRLLAGELQKWGFQEVTSVETLATTVQGERSATEIVMRGVDTAAAPIIINLIVHTEGNAITDFR
jgi:hypothetical protein